jgi:hypothetical protein
MLLLRFTRTHWWVCSYVQHTSQSMVALNAHSSAILRIFLPIPRLSSESYSCRHFFHKFHQLSRPLCSEIRSQIFIILWLTLSMEQPSYTYHSVLVKNISEGTYGTLCVAKLTEEKSLCMMIWFPSCVENRIYWLSNNYVTIYLTTWRRHTHRHILDIVITRLNIPPVFLGVRPSLASTKQQIRDLCGNKYSHNLIGRIPLFEFNFNEYCTSSTISWAGFRFPAGPMPFNIQQRTDRPALDPTHPRTQWVPPALFPKIKHPGLNNAYRQLSIYCSKYLNFPTFSTAWRFKSAIFCGVMPCSPAFRRNLLSMFSESKFKRSKQQGGSIERNSTCFFLVHFSPVPWPWRRMQYVPPKLRLPYTRLYSVTPQMTVVFMVGDIRTPNPTIKKKDNSSPKNNSWKDTIMLQNSHKFV